MTVKPKYAEQLEVPKNKLVKFEKSLNYWGPNFIIY